MLPPPFQIITEALHPCSYAYVTESLLNKFVHLAPWDISFMFSTSFMWGKKNYWVKRTIACRIDLEPIEEI